MQALTASTIRAAIDELQNEFQYDDEGYYREYISDFGGGNTTANVQLSDMDYVMFCEERNQLLIPVTFAFGHGSKYDPTDYIEDHESAFVLFDLNTDTFEQASYKFDPLREGFVEVSDELMAELA